MWKSKPCRFYCFQTDMEFCQQELNSPCIMEQSLLGEIDWIFHRSPYTVHSHTLLLRAADLVTMLLLFSAFLHITLLCTGAAMGKYKTIQHTSIRHAERVTMEEAGQDSMTFIEPHARLAEQHEFKFYQIVFKSWYLHHPVPEPGVSEASSCTSTWTRWSFFFLFPKWQTNNFKGNFDSQ